MKIHELKILPEYFDAVRSGDKRFELRRNDRDFHKGDILRLKEWDGEKYTGEEIDVLVRYILFNWTAGLQDGYCIMSIDAINDRRMTMPDREKVELGIKACWSEYFSHKCFDCPYVSDRNDRKCVERLGTDALALLKEQEAVEPYIAGSGESFETAETWWYECGNCNKPIDPNDKFCRHCGRQVKWE